MSAHPALRPVPADGVLLHIGPFKTGTTAIQGSLTQHRDELAAHRVVYPEPPDVRRGGATTRHARASWAVVGRQPRGMAPVDISVWEELVAEVHQHHEERVVLSSENFASAGPEVARRIVADLGVERLHVVLVARRLEELIRSAWQQRVKAAREARPFEEWLRDVISEPDQRSRAALNFWHNHDVGRILDTWLTVLPARQVSVIVSDPTDRSQQLRTFEGLLGLPAHLLSPAPGGGNTSLTYPRAEFQRRINELFAERGWEEEYGRTVIFHGSRAKLRDAPRHSSESALPGLPEWARDRMAELDTARIAAVTREDVQVVGDPAWLTTGRTGPAADQSAPEVVGIEVAARVVDGVVNRARAHERRAVRAAVRRERRRHAAARRRWQEERRRLEEELRSARSVRGILSSLVARVRRRG